MAKRSIIQALTSLVYNAHLAGFFTGSIWQGKSKGLCVPGLNCYSCPGALGACPIGALQSSLAGTILRFPFYVLGMLILFGLLLGRRICGWFCPFGFLQDLLYKLPTPKYHKNNHTRLLSKAKYFLGLLFVIILPLAYYFVTGIGSPTFCKFICPAGTLEAGWTLPLLNANLRSSLGVIFLWKSLVLVLILTASIFVYRPFCRFLCPLGAWYGFFNKHALWNIKLEESKCINCQACMKACLMDCQKVGDKECISCGKCTTVCPTHAISFKKGEI